MATSKSSSSKSTATKKTTTTKTTAAKKPAVAKVDTTPEVKEVKKMAEDGRVIKVHLKTYNEILELGKFSKISLSTLIDFAWQEFKESKQYAKIMLLGNIDSDKE